MDQVLGNEHFIDPRVLIAPISGNPVMESTAQTSTAELRTPSPLESLDDEDDGSGSAFNSGQKIKRKGRKDKSDTLVDMMVKRLEAEEEEKEEKKKLQAENQASLARCEEREQKLVDIFEVLAKHFIEKCNTK